MDERQDEGKKGEGDGRILMKKRMGMEKRRSNKGANFFLTDTKASE